MKKLEIGPPKSSATPDGQPGWDTVDVVGKTTFRGAWGTSPLPIPDNTYDWVFASHVLEHVPWWQALNAAKDAFRILKPGGRFTAWVPDGVKIVQTYVKEPEKLIEHNRTWNRTNQFFPERSAWGYMNAHMFWGASQYGVGRIENFHKSMYDYESLQVLLGAAGFCDTVRVVRSTGELARINAEVGIEGTKPA